MDYTNAGWNALGYPIGSSANYFGYQAASGGVDSGGSTYKNAYTNDGEPGNQTAGSYAGPFAAMKVSSSNGTQTCSFNWVDADLGITADPGLQYLVIFGVNNFNDDNTQGCTTVLGITIANNGVNASSPMILLE